VFVEATHPDDREVLKKHGLRALTRAGRAEPSPAT